MSAVSKKKFDLYLWNDDESIDNEYELTPDMDINELLLNTLETDADIRLRNAWNNMLAEMQNMWYTIRNQTA